MARQNRLGQFFGIPADGCEARFFERLPWPAEKRNEHTSSDPWQLTLGLKIHHVPSQSGRGLPQSTTLPRVRMRRVNSARFWAAAVLCRFRPWTHDPDECANHQGTGGIRHREFLRVLGCLDTFRSKAPHFRLVEEFCLTSGEGAPGEPRGDTPGKFTSAKLRRIGSATAAVVACLAEVARRHEGRGITIRGSAPVRCAFAPFAPGWLLPLLLSLRTGAADVESRATTSPRWVSILGEKEPGKGTLSVEDSRDSSTNNRANSARAVFRALASQSPWPNGLVPIYASKSGRGFELRRLPPPGEMDSSEPLFFALPADPADVAVAVGGTWNCVATHPDGQRKRVALDIVATREQVVARFDPNSDYRFASITSAAFQSNRLQLAVAYVNNRYEIEGRISRGVLTGTWKQWDTEEGGTWEGRRPVSEMDLPDSSTAVSLFEYESLRDGSRCYSLDAKWTAAGWRRRDVPLCRVWSATAGSQSSASVSEKERH